MAVGARVMAAGFPAPVAQALLGGVNTALVGTGSTNADALALTQDVSAFGTTAAGTGAILPSNATPGDEYFVYNGGANALLVYPPVGGAINNTAANTGFSVATLKSVTLKCIGNLLWVAMLGA